ncbi:MAG TPA: hypothetical protein VN663_22745 [Ramlibacter sp.]|nr:hypothetical protein [Ramlibacter sp.]
MATDLDALAAKVAELLASKPKKHDPRPILNCRVNADEMAMIDAAAAAKGYCRSDFVRWALNQVLPTVIPIERQIPEQLRRFMVRRKPDHFDDGKTDVRARTASEMRDLAARAHAAQLDYRTALIAQDYATAGVVRPAAQSVPGMIGETPSRSLLDKRSR